MGGKSTPTPAPTPTTQFDDRPVVGGVSNVKQPTKIVTTPTKKSGDEGANPTYSNTVLGS